MSLRGLAAEFLKAAIRKNKKMVLGDFSGDALADDQMGFGRGTPIDRYYLESFLSVHAKDIRGDVLEIAEDTNTKRFGDLNCQSRIKTHKILFMEICEIQRHCQK